MSGRHRARERGGASKDVVDTGAANKAIIAQLKAQLEKKKRTTNVRLPGQMRPS